MKDVWIEVFILGCFVVGIEVFNDKILFVILKEVLEDKFLFKYKLEVGIGRDIFGDLILI